MNRTPFYSRISGAYLIFALFWGASAACATDRYWNGGGGSDNINDGNNWGSSGTPGTGDNLYWNNTTGSHHFAYFNYGDYFTFGNIVFYSGAGGGQLYGNALKFTFKLENNSDPNQWRVYNSNVSVVSSGGNFQVNPVGGDLYFKLDGAGGTGANGTGSFFFDSGTMNVYGNNNKLLTLECVLANGSGGGNGSFALQENSQVRLAGTTSNSITGSWTVNNGTLDLSKNSTGTASANTALAISGTGGLTINGGTVNYEGANEINDASAVTVAGGTLNLATFNDTVGAVTLSSGTISGTTGILTGSSYGVQSGSVSAILGGTAALTKTTNGTVTLSGASTYSGGTALSAGTLNINNGGSSSTNSALGTGTLTIGGGILDNTSAGSLTLATNNAQTWNSDFAFTGTQSLNMGTGAVSLGTAAGTSRTITVNANTLTEGGVISNGTTAKALVKSGAGTLVLGGANTYSGGTTISAGTLAVANNAALGTSGTSTVSMANGTTLANLDSVSHNINNNNAITLTGAAGSTYNFLVNQNLTLGGNPNNVTSAGTAVNLNVSGGGTLFLLAQNANLGSVSTPAAWTVDGSTLSVLAGNNLGALPTASNFTQVTLQNNATLAGTGSFSPGRNLAINSSGGSLVDVLNTGLGALFFSPNVVDNADSTHTFTVNNTDATNALVSTIAGSISGTGSLTKTGAGTFTLSSANTYGGSTTIGSGTSTSGGTLKLGIANALPTTTSLIFNGGSSSIVDLNSFSQRVSSLYDGGSASGKITNNASGTGTATFTLNNTDNNFFFGTIVDGSTAHVAFTKTGSGTETLGGANTYSGGTAINAGTLVVANATALGASSGAVSVASGAALNLSGAIITNTNALTLNGTGISSGGALKNGNSTAATYAGLVSLGSDSSIIAGSGAITLSNTGTITGSGFGLTLGGAGGGTVASAIGTGTGGLTKQDGGTWTLTGTNTYSGATTISAGTLQIGSGSTTGTLGSGSVTDTGVLMFNRSNAYSVSNAIGGTGRVYILGGGTVNYGTAETYSGDTYVINGSTLSLGTAGSISSSIVRLGGDFGNIPGLQDQTKGATLELTNLTGGQSVGGVINSMSGNTSNALLIKSDNTSGINTLGANSYLDSALSTTVAAGGTLLFQGGSVDMKSQTLTIGGAGTTTMNESLTSSTSSSTVAGGSLIQAGPGTLIIQSTGNTYTGTNSGKLNASGTQISGGVLGIYGDTSLGVAPAGSYNNIQFTGSGTLQDTATSISLDAKRNISVASGATATFDSNGNVFTVNGVINGSGGIVGKVGAGTLSLTAANTYTGGTSVTAGTLLVGNTTGSATGTGAVAINGGTLAGGNGSSGFATVGSATLGIYGKNVSGIISGATTIASGAVLSAGNAGVGTLTFSNGLTLGNNANAIFEFGATANDFVSVGGALTIGTGVGLNLYASGGTTQFATNGTYDLFSYGSLSGSLANLSILNANSSKNYTFGTAIVSGTNYLTLSISDPGAYAYWKGGASNTWTNAGNFTSDSAGTTPLSSAVDGNTNVSFTADNASNFSTTLGANTTINSLTFRGTGGAGATDVNNPVTIAGNTLTINAGTANGNIAGNGIMVNAGSAANTISSNVALGASQTWTNNSTNALTVSGNVSGTGFTLTKAGSGTLTLSGTNSYSGGTLLNGGTISIGNNSALGSGSLAMATGTTLANNDSVAHTLTNAISLAGTVNFSGSQNLTLSTVAGGISAQGTLSGGNNLIINKTGNSVLTIVGDNSSSNGAASYIGTGATWNIGDGTGSASGSTGLFGPTVAVNGGRGFGTSTSSVINLNAGTIQFNAPDANGFTNSRTINVSAAGGALYDAGNAIGSSTTYNPLISIASGAGLNIDATNALTLGSTMSGAGGITKYGIGSLTLTQTGTSNSSYSGGTIVNAGLLKLGYANALGAGSGALAVNSAKLDLNGYNVAAGALTLSNATLRGLAVGSTPSAAGLVVSSASVTGNTLIGLSGSLTAGTLISSTGGGFNGGSYQFDGNAYSLSVPLTKILTTTNGTAFNQFSLSSTSTALQLNSASFTPNKTVNIMPLGASITEGVSAEPGYGGGGYRSELYANLVNDGRLTPYFIGSHTTYASPLLTTAGQTAQEGHAGYTTSQILNNLNGNDNSSGNDGGNWLATGNGKNPDYVILNVGGNDIAQIHTDTQAINRFDTILSQLNTLRSGADILATNLLYRTDVGSFENVYFNPYVQGVVYNHILAGQNLQFVDIYSYVTPGGNTSTYISSDGTHPTQAGYNLMGDIFYQALTYGQAYWTGSQGTTWSTLNGSSTNWAVDAARSTDRQKLLNDVSTTTYALPDVYFNSNASALNTTLGADVSVRSLNFAAGATGSVSIAGANTLSIGGGGITVQAGTGAHTISSNVALTADETWGNVSSNNLTVGGAISGAYNLNLTGSYSLYTGSSSSSISQSTISGTGGFVFSGANTYSGLTTISSGFLNIQNGSALGSTSSGTVVSSGASLQLQGGINVGAESLSLTGNTASAYSGTDTTGALRNISGGNSYGGAITMASQAAIGADAGSLTLNNTLNNGGYRLIVAGAGNVVATNSISGGGDLLKQGSGTLTLTGNNSFGGTASIYMDKGTVEVGTGGNLGTTNGTSTGWINMSASVNGTNGDTNLLARDAGVTIANPIDARHYLVDVPGTETVGGENTSGTATFSGTVSLHDNVTLTAAAGGTVAFSGLIQPGGTNNNQTSGQTLINSVGGGVTKTGDGTVVLTKATGNTYAGGTTVTAGTLLISNTSGSATGSGAVTVNNSGTLTGTGLINAGANSIVINGTLSPGSAAAAGNIGTISLASTASSGALTLASTSTLLFDIVSTASKDLVSLTNTSLAINGASLALNLPNMSSSGIDYTKTYALFTGVNSFSGAGFGSITGYDSTDWVANTGRSGTEYDLTFTPVPEPSTWLAAVLAVCTVSGMYLRRARNRCASRSFGGQRPSRRGALELS